MTSLEDELFCGDEDRIIAALYELSGDGRDTPLSDRVNDLSLDLIESENEELAWRAIFFFGLVKLNKKILPALLKAYNYWINREDYIAISALDAISRIIGLESMDKEEREHILAKLKSAPKINPKILDLLVDLVYNKISYKTFVEQRDIIRPI
jgi:hypothetical protein